MGYTPGVETLIAPDEVDVLDYNAQSLLPRRISCGDGLVECVGLWGGFLLMTKLIDSMYKLRIRHPQGATEVMREEIAKRL
jgi:hypothetical protein